MVFSRKRILNRKSAAGLILFIIVIFVLRTFITNRTQAATQIGTSLGTLPGAGRQVVRTSTGTLYTFVNASGTCEVFKSTDGTTWTEQDSANHPTCTSGNPVSIAVDSTNKLHIIYITGTNSVKYNTMTSDVYGTAETVPATLTGFNSVSLFVDSSDVPHVWYSYNNGATTKGAYSNRVGGTWDASPTLTTESTVTIGDGVIDKDNKPEACYISVSTSTLVAAIGNSNDATSFTTQNLDTTVNTTGGTRGCSIAVDSLGNTWVAYVDTTGTNNINLIEHKYGDAWSTWQTAVTDSKTGKAPSVAANGTDVYIFYQNSLDDVAYDKYTSLATWKGETTLQTGTFQTINAKSSYLDNNFGGRQIDYLYSDGTNIFWDKLSLGSMVWAEAGSAETNDTTFWTTVNGASAGTITSDTKAVAGSVRSIKFHAPNGGDVAYAYQTQDILSDAGRRVDFYMNLTSTTPSNNYAIFAAVNSSDSSTAFGMGMLTSGKLGIFGGASTGTIVATGTHTLSPNTDYRITIDYTITDATHNTVTVYVNGQVDISATNLANFNNGVATRFEIGISDSMVTGPGVATDMYVAHIYVDDGTGGDPGDIRVTAKLPCSNGTTNAWTTNGTPSGFCSGATGNSQYVSERPLPATPSTSARMSTTSTASSVEEYSIQGASAGDVDISNYPLADYMGWVYASGSTSLSANMILAGSTSAVALTTTNTVFTSIAGSTTYPAGGTDIGMNSGTAAGTKTLYEAGIVVAYYPVSVAAPTNTPTPTLTPTPTPTLGPTVNFMEAGSAETNDVSTFYNTVTLGSGTTPASDTQSVAGSVRSIKCTVTSGSTDDSYIYYPGSIINSTGGRISYSARWTNTTPAHNYTIVTIVNTADNATNWGLGLTTAGKIGIFDGGFPAVLQATGNTVLSPNTDYRISIAYSITDATHNTITVYLNGVQEVSTTNITIGTNIQTFELGLSDSYSGSPQTATTVYIAHVYTDSGTSGDTGDIRVTAKRPYANGTTNDFTGGGTPSGYGSGNAQYVNERPPNTTTNFVSLSITTTKKTEEYTIEDTGLGDKNLLGTTLVDYMGWIIAENSTATNAVSDIIVNGTATPITLVANNMTLFTQVAGSRTYPTGGAVIGMDGRYTSGSGTYTLGEAGIMEAYIQNVPVQTHGGTTIHGGTILR